ncbi:response regulator transcription factor [Halalkalibacter kiskunsagensis]|uniref:Response regulator transcription factor n=1 Tax=Halalkalibacter kiskunsagensis TaxID=1548599 RepID=A0ABV6KI57_9BACI
MWSVVIIDDEERVLRGMKKIIPWEELGCAWVGEAKNGQIGLDVVKERNPDIIITDIYMPVMNGLEMIEALRDEGYKGRVIILSGYSDFENARKAMRLNISDYLSKPASIQTIKVVLEKLICDLEQDRMERVRFAELREKVKVYEPLIEKEWIKSVVTGTASLSSIPDTIKSVTNDWEDKNHVILSITYNENLESSKLYQSDWYLFRFATKNIIQEAATAYFKDFHYIELHSHQAVISIHFTSKHYQEIMKELTELCQTIEKSIRTCLDVEVSVNVGGIKKQWNELGNSLREAIYELSTSPSNKDSTTIEHNPEFGLVSPEQQALWSESMEAIQQLSEAIRYADEQAACKVLDDFLSHVNVPFNQSTSLRIGIEMWTIMTYSLYDIGIRIHDMFPRQFDLYKELSDKHSWEELVDFLKEKVKQICQHQQWDENLKHNQLVEQMIDYVQERLHENITLQDIANELYISRNYLGQIFKKVVGESFKNYLTRIRMEKAKKMIQEGHFLIYEVSEKVGYVNRAYFTTAFKKYTGYTPTELINKKCNQ